MQIILPLPTATVFCNTLLFLITGDATVIWKQGDRVIFADKIHVSTEMRASIVDRTSLLLRGVDTQYTGKNYTFKIYFYYLNIMGMSFLINQLCTNHIAYQYLYCQTFFHILAYLPSSLN